jgi:transcriptional regulator NrdR family protein
LDCGSTFTTEESTQYSSAWTVKDKKGALQAFSRDKMFLSLYNSLQHRQTAREDASGLADTIINKLALDVTDGAMTSTQISATALVALNRFDKAASTHYQAFHPNT